MAIPVFVNSSANRSSSSWKLHVLLAGALVFLWNFALYAGLPCNFTADLVTAGKALPGLSYGKLWAWVFDPRTPAWFFADKMETLRPLKHILIKFFIEHSRGSLFGMHVVIALSGAVLTGVFFYALFKWTGERLIPWLVLGLYFTLPVQPVMLMGYVGLYFHYLISLLTFLAFLLFGGLLMKPSSRFMTRAVMLLGWVLLTWLLIKWRSSEKLLPLICLAGLFVYRFIQLRGRPCPFGMKWLLILLAVNLLMFIFVIPVHVPRESSIHSSASAAAEDFGIVSKKDKRMYEVSAQNLWQRTFSHADDEALFRRGLWPKDPAKSFSGNLGWPLAGLFWLLFPAALLMSLRPLKPESGIPDSLLTGLKPLFYIWFSGVILSFASGASLSDVRYLNLAYVPAIFIFADILFHIQYSWLRKGALKTLARWVIAGLFLWTILANMFLTLKDVRQFGGLQHAAYEADVLMYRHLFGSEPSGLEVFRRHAELESRAVLVEWYGGGSEWKQEAVNKIMTEGQLFYSTMKAEGADSKLRWLRTRGYEVEKLGAFSLDDAHPLVFYFFRWLEKIQGEESRRILIYRIAPRSGKESENGPA